jgi:hypothetical protein
MEYLCDKTEYNPEVPKLVKRDPTEYLLDWDQYYNSLKKTRIVI